MRLRVIVADYDAAACVDQQRGVLRVADTDRVVNRYAERIEYRQAETVTRTNQLLKSDVEIHLQK